MTTLFPIALGLLILAPRASATVVDLTTHGSSGDIGDAHFVQSTIGSGTGVIEPFLRLQKNNVEKGVNSDGPYTMDEKAGNWTHSTRISDFGVTELNGVASIRFLLDINENNHEELLSLDRLKIYVAPISKFNTLAELDASATLIYDMGAGNKVLLNYDLEAGSGESDMTAYLPYRLFIPYEGQYLYLFCEFGATGGDYSSDDGFEEWATAGDPPIVGACCFEDGHCEILPEADCESRGGMFQGSMTSCDPNPCDQPTGACCFPDGSCVVTTEDACGAQGGSYNGDGALCDPNPCDQPTGACCFPDGSCAVATESDCAAQGGSYYGDGSLCDPNPCDQPTGACCFPDGSCIVTTEDVCVAQGGSYYGDGSLCDPNPCDQPTGACCFPDGSCGVATEDECAAQGGSYYGDGTLCDPNPCTQTTGACCLPDESCIVVTEEECAAQGGTYYGDGSECAPNSCHTVPTLERSWGQVKNSFHR